MPHLDLGAYLSDDALTLDNVPSEKHPDGKSYTIASPSARFTLQLRRMMEVWGARDGDTAPSETDIADLVTLTTGEDGKPVDFRKRLLGPAHDEMVDDGISGERLQMISNVVMAHYGTGPHVAEAIVASLGKPPARPNRATRRTGKKTAGGKSPKASGGSATRTPQPDSPASSTSPGGSDVPVAAAG